MNKGRCLRGAVLLALGGFGGPVEARVVRYEIHGKVYTYETTDRQQVARARQRIEAANAADAAKARAHEELVRTPLVAIVGSAAQREASASQARLQQLMSQPEPVTPTVWSAAGIDPAEGRPTREMARVDNRSGLPALKVEPSQAQPKMWSTANAMPEAVKLARQRSSVAEMMSDKAPAPALSSSGQTQKSALKSITFDFSNGIKTVQMMDGTIHEEPLDSSILAKLRLVDPTAESLTSFIEQVRTTRSRDVGDNRR